MSKAPKKPGTASTTAKSGAKASKGPGAKAAAAAASKSAAGAKGSKSFPCEQCTKVFNAAWKLKRHMRVHTGEKPFACDVPGCNKRYSEKGALVSPCHEECGLRVPGLVMMMKRGVLRSLQASRWSSRWVVLCCVDL